MESLANYYLINTSATVAQQAENSAAGRKNPGNNLYTTLDMNLQQTAYNAMGIYKGAIVVMGFRTRIFLRKKIKFMISGKETGI